MDKDTLVSEKTESGERLIAALAAAGFDIRIAFWATLTDEGKWYLYLASQMVDDEGPMAAYRLVQRVLRDSPDVWLDPLEIRVVGLNDTLAKAALAVIEPTVPNSPYAVRRPRPYPQMTWYSAATLGGIGIDGAYIYPPSRAGASA